jgi:hypothetical protein
MKVILRQFLVNKAVKYEVKCSCGAITQVWKASYKPNLGCEKCRNNSIKNNPNAVTFKLRNMDTSKYTIYQLAEMLDRKAKSIQYLLNQLKLPYIKTDKMIDILRKMDTSLYTIKQLAEIPERTESSVSSAICKHKLPYKPFQRPKKEKVIKEKPSVKPKLTYGEWVMNKKDMFYASNDRGEIEDIMGMLEHGKRPKRMGWDDRVAYYGEKLNNVWIELGYELQA